jgi:hypothetical protein
MDKSLLPRSPRTPRSFKNILKKPLKFINPSIIFITFLNIAFFMVVQILFFYIIASKQIDVIIESKTDIVNEYIKHSDKSNDFIKDYLESDEYKKDREYAKNIKDKRLELNRKIIWLKLKPILIPVFVITGLMFIILIIFSFKRTNNLLPDYLKDKFSLSLSDKILVLCVVGAFSTELLFFFGMVNNYEFIGDYEILNIVYKSFAKNYNNSL